MKTTILHVRNTVSSVIRSKDPEHSEGSINNTSAFTQANSSPQPMEITMHIPKNQSALNEFSMWMLIILVLFLVLTAIGVYIKDDPIPAAINPAGFVVHEHKTPSGKSCYMLYSGTEVVAFTCD